MTAEISVILPVYNGQQFICSSIDSILNQTFDNFELIVVNDGSTDRTPELLRNYHDPRLTIHDNPENCGLIYSLNAGIRRAAGNFIARMDADDVSEPARFQKQYQFLKQHPEISIVGSQVKFFDRDLKSEVFHRKYPQTHGEIAWDMLFNCCIAHPTVMARRDVFQNNMGYMPGWETVEDYELWTRLIPAMKFANLNRALLQYRVHNLSVSRQKQEMQRKKSLTVRSRYISALTNSEVSENVVDLVDRYKDASPFEIEKIESLINYLYDLFIERRWLTGNEKDLENGALIHAQKKSWHMPKKAFTAQNDVNLFDFSNTPVSKKRPVYFYQPADANAEPAVTIVTPYYNTGEIFRETAQSVLRQSFQQWEWILVNDGSTDAAALAVLDEYRGVDARIRVVDQPKNLGPSAARNKGYALARAKYVVQLDSDDLLEPTAVEKWYWYLETHPEVSFAKGYCVGFSAKEYLYEGGFHQNERFLVENCVDLNCIIKKSVHDIVGGYDEANRLGLEDWDFWMHCAAHGFWGATLPEYHDWYRRSENYSEKWPNWNLEKIGDFAEVLKQRYPGLWNNGFPRIPAPQDRPVSLDLGNIRARNLLAKKKKRLLLILPWLRVGGADKFNLDILRQLSQQEWEISILTVLEGDHSWSKEFEKYTPDIFILNNFLPKEDYPRFIHYFIGSRNFDAVISTMNVFGYKILPYIRSLYPDIAIIDILHMEEENGDFGAYPATSIEYQKTIDFHLTTSKRLMNRMIEHGLDPDRVDVCYTNVETRGWGNRAKERQGANAALQIDDQTALIIYVARLCKQKQPRVLAKTLKILKDEGAAFKALVIGDGPDREMLEALITQYGLQDQVTMLGAVDNHKTNGWMRAADILFLPSFWEGLALTIYEAMAAGLPVVGADVGGQSELVTAECGYLLPRSEEDTEAQGYAGALQTLLLDPELRTQMGSNGKKRVEKYFRLDQLGPRLEALLSRAIELHGRRPLAPVPPAQGGLAAESAVQYAKQHRTWIEPKTEAIAAPNDRRPLAAPAMEGKAAAQGPRVRLYRLAKGLLFPIYTVAKRKNIRFITDLRFRLRKKLISDEDSYNSIYAAEGAAQPESQNAPTQTAGGIGETETAVQQLRAGNEYLMDIHKRDVDAIQQLRAGNEWLDAMRKKDQAYIAELARKVEEQSKVIEADRLLLKDRKFMQFVGAVKYLLVKITVKIRALGKR